LRKHRTIRRMGGEFPLTSSFSLGFSRSGRESLVASVSIGSQGEEPMETEATKLSALLLPKAREKEEVRGKLADRPSYSLAVTLDLAVGRIRRQSEADLLVDHCD